MHDHDHGDNESRLMLATSINLGITIAQVLAGIAAGSVGLLADAAHNLTDTASIAMAIVAIRLARREPGAAWTYGGVRWPILAAQANGIVTLLLTFALAAESINRLTQHHHNVKGGVVLIVALLAAAGNAVALILVSEKDATLNTRAVMLHLAADVLSSLGVAVAGAVILISSGATWVDPLASLVIAAVIGWQGLKLLKQSSLVLLEAVPPGLNMELLNERVKAVPGVRGLHDLHVWSLSDNELAASAHLELDGHPTLQETRVISDQVKQLLHDEFSIGHATLEAE